MRSLNAMAIALALTLGIKTASASVVTIEFDLEVTSVSTDFTSITPGLIPGLTGTYTLMYDETVAARGSSGGIASYPFISGIFDFGSVGRLSQSTDPSSALITVGDDGGRPNASDNIQTSSNEFGLSSGLGTTNLLLIASGRRLLNRPDLSELTNFAIAGDLSDLRAAQATFLHVSSIEATSIFGTCPISSSCGVSADVTSVRVVDPVAAVPLPASLPMLLAGVGGLAFARRRMLPA